MNPRHQSWMDSTRAYVFALTAFALFVSTVGLPFTRYAVWAFLTGFLSIAFFLMAYLDAKHALQVYDAEMDRLNRE